MWLYRPGQAGYTQEDYSILNQHIYFLSRR